MNYRALSLFALAFTMSLQLSAQTLEARVVSPVDDRVLVAVPSSIAPLAAGMVDDGAVGESTPLERMQLVLKRSPQQEATLRQLIEQQQDSASVHFHQWLTPQAFGAQFGPADSDIQAVTGWLSARGFTNIHVNAGRTLVEFSGTAGSVQAAFHTAVHRYELNGQQTMATRGALRVPAALEPVVAGFASLSGAMPAGPVATTRLLTRDGQTGEVASRVAAANGQTANGQTANGQAAEGAAAPAYTTATAGGQTVYAVTPSDFATIYNVAPLWSSKIDGTNQTIAVVGQSDINPQDFVNFRTLFGLPIDRNQSPTATSHLNIIYNGPNPGLNADEITGDADTQWSGAIAKGAVIDYVASQTTGASLGSDLSAAYIVDNNLAPVMVDSFSRCERDAGSGYDVFITNLWQQAAAQGITVVAAAGDSGSAGCDATGAGPASGATAGSASGATAAPATQGLAVNAIASTPYDVAVGGTDFYMPSGGGAYWNGSNDGSTQASAKGYIPEAVWNDSCANPAYSSVAPYNGESPQQVCNNAQAASGGLVTVRGGGGGPSTCTQAGGGCTGGTAKPSWQTGAGVPNDQVRDVPDLSLFSGDGAFSTLYFVCQQSADPSGAACALGKPSVNFVGAGGTAFASAAFAGVMALVNQEVAQKSPNAPPGQGNANYTLYALANQQAKTGAGCNATGSPSASCIFHDITVGTNAMPCTAGSANCNGSGVGILSGYSAAANYDLASGLGSINVANLVNGWQSVSYRSTTTSLALNPLSIVHGQTIAATVTVSSSSGTPTGEVTINAEAANGSVGGGALTSGTFAANYTTFPGGSYAVHAFYGGDGTFGASESVPVDITVTPEPSITTEKITDQNNQPVTGTVPYGDILTLQAGVAGVSGQGTATGNVHITQAPNTPLYGGAFRLNSSGYTDVKTNSLTPAQYSFVSSYDGDPSFQASVSAAYPLTITKANTSAAATASTYNAADNTSITFTVTIGTVGFGYLAPSGVVTLTSNGTTIGSAALQGQPGSGANFDKSVAFVTVPAVEIPYGPNPVSVSYPGDTNYNGSSGVTAPVTVTNSGLPTTTTKLNISPQSVAPKGSVTFTAMVISTASGINGEVQFAIDGQNVGAPMTVVNGIASEPISIAGFASGPHNGTAIYEGDTTHKSSFSNTAGFVITGATGPTASVAKIQVNPTTAEQGTGVQISALVAAQVPGTPTPTGTIQLLVDNNFNGAPLALQNAAGSFTLVTSVLQAGLHTATVYYSGDSVYMPSYSQPVPFTILAPGNSPTTVTLSNVPSPVGAGVTFPFTATVHTNSTNPNAPAASGTLEVIVDKGVPQPQMPLTSNPQNLTLDTTGLTLGLHTVAVYYSGDITYTAATSLESSFTVIPANSTFTLSPSSATAHIPIATQASTPVTFTVTPTVGGSFPVSFACSNLPAGIGCAFSPATVNVVGLQPATTVLTLVGINTSQLGRHQPPSDRTLYGAFGGVSFAGLLLCLVPGRRRRISSLLAVLVLVALGAASGCGGTIAPERGPYAVTVTATSAASALGVTTRTAVVQLTIGGAPTAP